MMANVVVMLLLLNALLFHCVGIQIMTSYVST